MAYETLTFDVDPDGIALLTLNRPDALNSFTVTMARELEEVFTTEAMADEVRAIVVTGAGKAFCAGMDLSAEGNVFGLDESLKPTPQTLGEHLADPAKHPEYAAGVRDTGGKVTLAIHALPKPVIAAINGPAVGIGATMLCAMDARLASSKAKIGFVFGKLGIVPEACSSYFLPRVVGIPRALEWLYTAEILNPDQALEGGLVRSIHLPDELLPAAYKLARRFTQNRSPVGTALVRQLITRNASARHPLEAHLSDSLAMFYASIGDGKEGVAAFLEKRDPEFTSKASELPTVFPDADLHV
ncbi:MAG: crotonase/enoyl-CoA hydratase family protein [Nocardioides sp.]|uniref:crotonase/enoyl-CoA hydratase family protein n=1 Tax=Nocardioides sp. TaxID=35761 RepID=UPI003D6BA59A